MRNALLVVSGVAIGLLGALVTMASNGSGMKQAEAQAVQSDAGTSTVIMGTGGSMPNTNDLCWLFFKDRAKDKTGKEHDRYSLCMYKSTNNGQAFDLVGEREVTYDMKATLLPPNIKTAFSPKDLKKAWEDTQKPQEQPNQPPRNP